jgi:hypothetical protein
MKGLRFVYSEPSLFEWHCEGARGGAESINIVRYSLTKEKWFPRPVCIPAGWLQQKAGGRNDHTMYCTHW